MGTARNDPGTVCMKCKCVPGLLGLSLVRR
jgi:hypothetical protein